MKPLEVLVPMIWIGAYLAAILIAVAQSGTTAQKSSVRSVFLKFLPYFLALISVIWNASSKGAFELAGWSAFSLIITWAMIFTTKKQWLR